MQQLKQIVIQLSIVLVLELAACCYLIINRSIILLCLTIIPMPVVAAYFCLYLSRLKAARLIMENTIFSIPSGKVWSSDGSLTIKGNDKPALVIVSSFGILHGAKVYKFNCDGIRLFSINIDRNSMFLTYGTEEKRHHLKLLHGLFKEDDIKMVAEKFRYETGIISTLSKS